MLKKFIAHSLVFSLIFNNLAFATHQILELDFKGSQTPQRLHVIPRMSNVGDVSHLEIDTEQRQAVVYLKEKQEEALDEVEKNSSQGSDVPVTTKPVILKKHDIINLPWELETEKLTLFILNHNAWLSPLDEDGYKLEFKGGLLGGMMKKKELTITVYPGGVDCGGRNDWPKGTIGDKFCRNNGNGLGNTGIIVFNKPYVPPVDKEWEKHCEKACNPFGNQKPFYIPPREDKKPELKKVSVPSSKAPIFKADDKKIHQAVGKEVREAAQPLINKLYFNHDRQFRDISQKILDFVMEAFAPYQGGDIPQKTLDEIVRNIGLRIDPMVKKTDSFRMINPTDYYRVLDKDGRCRGKSVDQVSREAVSRTYEGLKKQYAEELEKFKKKQKIEEEQLKKLNQEKHTALVQSLSQKFMRQGRGFSELKKPFQQTADGSIYKGNRYNVEFPLSPVELEACQGKTVCLYSHLKTDTPDVCRVQVVAFKGNVVVGNACSEAMPSGKWGYLFTALHFDFNDYDSVWVRPLRTGGTQDSMISAWSYSTWITDIPIKQEETSHVKIVQNSQNTISFAFPDSPLVYPSFSKDRTTVASFFPSGVTLSSAAIATSNWAKYNYVCPSNIPDSHQHIVESTVYVINHALQEIMQDCSTGDEWDKAEAVSLIRYMTSQHLKRTNSESLENVSKVKGINYVTDYMLPSVIRYNLNEMQKAKEPFDDQVVQDWAETDWTGLVKQVGKKLPFDIDPMKPHDMFNLEDKMAGCGAGGGKLGWNRILGKGKPQQAKIEPKGQQPVKKVEEKKKVEKVKDQKIEVNQIKINNEKVSQANRTVQEYLGKDYKIMTNNQGDKIFLSNDGNRKVRFDYKYSHGDKQHVHIEEKDISGKWKDATSQHRIYFEGDLK